MLYHATTKRRLDIIAKEGFNPLAETISSEYIKKELGDEYKEPEEDSLFYEDAFTDCSTEAEEYLNEDLNRGDNVFFSLSKGRALDLLNGLRSIPYENVVIKVNPDKIPCICKVSDQSIADDIYEEYYHACMQDILVDSEKIEKLVDDWDKSVRVYNPDNETEYSEYDDEVWCPCKIPPDAIEKVYDSKGIEICRRDERGVLKCDTEDGTERAISWEHRRPPSKSSLIRESEIWG